ncbi:phosphate/phosphite/phosphonate ABC transporter substrate-binding protein [Cypionkella sp.]|uniref:phosphate/phosphite/phosphonate ABC transporter substrate-binding protein n=1 Tax=Cypionkella sp. TaxID=2811411 RepID=UPI002ABAFF1B|nr:PhnD/SsuA/transferrin family substrate-binding protein [Cypionkella sp.]MDZ4393013.1 PhnD/SsuA/transferrin family substrate-binding protein [Cypionkella sp.]
MLFLANLPMYDFHEVRPHTDALWAAIADALRKREIEAPDVLSRTGDHTALWSNENLLFSQTCGYPFVSQLRGAVTLVGTPDYGVIPDKPGWYNSVIVCRKNDPRTHLSDFAGARWSYNETGSQSGCRALMYAVLQEVGEGRHFGSCHVSGSHISSARAVSDDTADIAALDHVTWLFMKRYDYPGVDKLRVLTQTPPTPGLPYIAAKACDGSIVADAFCEALENLPSETLNPLFLKGFWPSKVEDYDLIAERAAQSAGVFSAHFPE